MRYHINWKGEPGLCSAQSGNCPLGATDEHFATAQDARAAYEQAHASFTAPLTPSQILHNATATIQATSWEDLQTMKDNLQSKSFSELTDDEHIMIAAIVSEQEHRLNELKKKLSDGHGGWKDDTTPDVKDSKIIVPPQENDAHGGYMGGRRWRGGKVTDNYLPQKEAAKNIRHDIREALKAGELPKDLTYNVRMNSGSWVTSISIYVGRRGADGKPVELDLEDQQDSRMKTIVQYLGALGNQYSTDDSNAQVDYFNSHNHARVSFWSKYV